jgi:hypothetical protein
MRRGENCIDARVRVISKMAKTIDTTVIRDQKHNSYEGYDASEILVAMAHKNEI